MRLGMSSMAPTIYCHHIISCFFSPSWKESPYAWIGCTVQFGFQPSPKEMIAVEFSVL